jgi:AcrR family transcriptional regulator
VARATLNYYFSGRDDLLSFVLAEHIRRGAEIIAAANGESPAERLRVTVAGEGMAVGEFAEGDLADVTSALIGAVLMQVVSRYLRAAAIESDETVAEVTEIAMRVVAGPG